jgi:hypothetical protein
MNSRTKNKKVTEPASIDSTKIAKTLGDSKVNFRFIVTRNTRNAWIDDMYQSTIGHADYPTFH